MNIIEEPITVEQEKLVQSPYNTNVAFYIHLKSFNNSVREELEKRITEVFFFTRGVDWKFDSFGIEKAGSRGTEILGYFIFNLLIFCVLNIWFRFFKSYSQRFCTCTGFALVVK